MATITNLVVTPRVRPGGRRTKPQKLFRGKSRTMIRNTINHLVTLGNMDAREMRRAAALKFSPALVLGPSNSVLNNSYLRLLTALQDAMKTQTG